MSSSRNNPSLVPREAVQRCVWVQVRADINLQQIMMVDSPGMIDNPAVTLPLCDSAQPLPRPIVNRTGLPRPTVNRMALPKPTVKRTGPA